MMTLSPSKSFYQIGEVVSVGYLVTDQYNNQILNYPVEISSNPHSPAIRSQTFSPGFRRTIFNHVEDSR